jgi:hypothetical protein
MKSRTKEKQAYHSPQVKDYGNVRQITLALGNRGADDGGRSPTHKTGI